MFFFVSEALASDINQTQGNPYFLVIMIIVFGLIFYFMILRSQQKRVKEHTKLVNSISKGDEILTTCGLIGHVTKVTETGYIIVALNDTNKVIIKRDFVAAILPRGTIKSI